MATRDITNQLETEVVFTAAIATDTTTSTASVDMSDFDSGFYFTMTSYDHTDGTYVMTLQESEDDSSWSNVPAAALLPSGTTEITVDDQAVAGFFDIQLGAFSTKRYIRGSIVSSVTTSGATLTIVATKKAENRPVPIV